jgi:hypothetical protein
MLVGSYTSLNWPTRKEQATSSIEIDKNGIRSRSRQGNTLSYWNYHSQYCVLGLEKRPPSMIQPLVSPALMFTVWSLGQIPSMCRAFFKPINHEEFTEQFISQSTRHSS